MTANVRIHDLPQHDRPRERLEANGADALSTRDLIAILLRTGTAGRSAIHVAEEDTFSATLKCHDASGEIYYVSFGREQVRVTSYSDDAILATIETWADTKPELA